jgi:hypothetical protein
LDAITSSIEGHTEKGYWFFVQVCQKKNNNNVSMLACHFNSHRSFVVTHFFFPAIFAVSRAIQDWLHSVFCKLLLSLAGCSKVWQVWIIAAIIGIMFLMILTFILSSIFEGGGGGVG